MRLDDVPGIGNATSRIEAASRELDDALLRLRFNHPDVGVVVVQVRQQDRVGVAPDLR